MRFLAPLAARLSARFTALVLLIGACSLVALGCGGQSRRVRIEALDRPVSRPRIEAIPRVAVPEGLHDRIERAVAAMPPGHVATRARIVAEDAEADVRVSLLPQGSAGGVIARRWAVVTDASRIELDGISSQSLTQAARSGPLYVVREHAALVTQLLAAGEGVRPVTAAAIADRLAAEPTALGIVPVDTITVRVRALALDGIDPVRGTGDQAAYPLVTRVQLRAGRSGGESEAVVAALGIALERSDPPPVRVLFTGDIIPARCVYEHMARSGDYTAPFHAVAGPLRAAHITVGSLDAAVSDRAVPIGCRETLSLLAPPEVVWGFLFAGFDVLTVAANHAKDCGAAGSCGDAPFLDTLRWLRTSGIRSTGGGMNRKEARRPAIVTAGGVRFAFLGYDDIAPHYHAGETTPGTAGLDLNTLPADIRAARAMADVVVVLPQWGAEYTPHPTARQREAARAAVEAGATLVVGNHPHVVQAAMPLGDAYVAWALGNFVFDQDWSPETMEGVVLEATFAGPRLAAVRFLPIRIQGRLRPVFLSGVEGRAVLKRISDAAAAVRGREE